MKLKHVGLLATFVLVIMSIQGCVNVGEKLKLSYIPTHYSPSVSDYPTIGELNTVEVGESLVWKDKQTTIPAIDIEQVIEHPQKNLAGVTWTLISARYVEKGKDAFGKFYEAPKGKLLINGNPYAFGGGIYVTDSAPQKTEIYVISGDGRPWSHARDGIPFTKSFYQQRDELSLKKELVYTGISQNVVSILYREFKEDIARPAFSQDLKYDLSESKIVGYRGARFEIIKATNQGLTYKTLKQLD